MGPEKTREKDVDCVRALITDWPTWRSRARQEVDIAARLPDGRGSMCQPGLFMSFLTSVATCSTIDGYVKRMKTVCQLAVWALAPKRLIESSDLDDSGDVAMSSQGISFNTMDSSTDSLRTCNS